MLRSDIGRQSNCWGPAQNVCDNTTCLIRHCTMLQLLAGFIYFIVIKDWREVWTTNSLFGRFLLCTTTSDGYILFFTFNMPQCQIVRGVTRLYVWILWTCLMIYESLVSGLEYLLSFECISCSVMIYVTFYGCPTQMFTHICIGLYHQYSYKKWIHWTTHSHTQCFSSVDFYYRH